MQQTIGKAFTFRLSPNADQAQKMVAFAGANRFVWNKALAMNLFRLEHKQSILWYQEMNFWLGLLISMQTYNFLTDEVILQEFVNTILVNLTEDECYLLLLCARRKYLTSEEANQCAIGGTEVLRREIISDKSKLLPKVKELCVIQGLYEDKKGQSIPEHAFAVYITINPKSYKKAAITAMKDLIDKIAAADSFRLDSLIKNHIHKAVSRKIYLDLDIDPAEADDLTEIIKQIKIILGKTPLNIIKTKKGAHVLLQKEAIDPVVKKTFYQDIQKLSKNIEGEIEMKSDDMLPIPGTYQANFTPYFLKN